MKDIRWLINRLRSMNALEMGWRVQQKFLQKKEYKADIVQSFTEAIIKIHRMPEMYEKLARGAWESRSRYDIKEYRTELRSGLRM